MGANDYNSDVLEFCGQKAATVQYKIKDLGNKDSVSTWIGCQIYGTTNNVSDLGKKDPKFEIKIKINITKAHSLSIVDTIEEDGCLGVKDPQNIKYKWQRSSDGVNDWQDIPEKRDDCRYCIMVERNLMFLVMQVVVCITVSVKMEKTIGHWYIE